MHPLDRGLFDGGNGTVDGVRRVKVRMTREQLKELMKKTASKDGVNNNDSDWLARLVYEECVKGSLHGCVSVVVDSGDSSACKKWYRGHHSILAPIQEHSDDVVYGE